MHQTKYTRLLTDCQAAIAADNLEKCLELLRQGFNLHAETRKDLNLLEGNWNRAKRFYGNGQLSYADFSKDLTRVADALGNILEKLSEDDVSTSDNINDRILIVSCKNSPTDWENLFPEAFFSHVRIIQYRDEVPEGFRAADIVIFDDLKCAGSSREVFMRSLARELPQANLLYFGKFNPFQDSDFEGDDAIFERMANANSRFTIHARLRELLEYRKIYGTG